MFSSLKLTADIRTEHAEISNPILGSTAGRTMPKANPFSTTDIRTEHAEISNPILGSTL